jgi:hypothetical protein
MVVLLLLNSFTFNITTSSFTLALIPLPENLLNRGSRYLMPMMVPEADPFPIQEATGSCKSFQVNYFALYSYQPMCGIGPGIQRQAGFGERPISCVLISGFSLTQ